MLIGTSVYAQKRYVYIQKHERYGSGSTISLSGCIPTDMDTTYKNVSVGTIIDELAQRGYVVEQLSNAGFGYNWNYSDTRFEGVYREVVIMSISSGQTISKGDVNTDGEVNIADVNEVISLIFGIVREHPEILEQIKKQSNH